MGMSQNFPVNSFKWGGETFQFNEDFKESYNKDCDEVCFHEVDVQYPGKYTSFIKIYHYKQELKLRN